MLLFFSLYYCRRRGYCNIMFRLSFWLLCYFKSAWLIRFFQNIAIERKTETQGLVKNQFTSTDDCTLVLSNELQHDIKEHLRLIFGNAIHCSRIHCSILNLHLCPFSGCFQWMFFSSVKETNRLISKGISKIYLNVTIEKNWRSQNFSF